PTYRFLHVDDEESFLRMASETVERKNDDIDVEARTNVDEGLDYLSENCVDCVVSDYQMPEKDGIDFLREVRDSYRNLPFILFTGEGSEEIASEAISAGVTDYLQKEMGTAQYD
ncbi:MAG: response regulator, partial [Halobacteria archaeon]|nr:response regulator [Halobacteria archaeon]